MEDRGSQKGSILHALFILNFPFFIINFPFFHF